MADDTSKKAKRVRNGNVDTAASNAGVNSGLGPGAFDNVPRARLTLTRETIWMERFDNHGLVTAIYPVHSSAVAGAFGALGSDTGLLPPGTLFVQTRNGEQRVGYFVPARQWKLVFDGDEVLNVPMPCLVFVGQGTSYWVWAVSSNVRGPETQLYQAPLPNVHADGRICTGSARFPVCSVCSMEAAVRVFFESEFNNDLSSGRLAPGFPELKKYLRQINGETLFPPEALLRTSLTVGDVWGEQI